MRLNIFDRWTKLPVRFGRELEYQTRKDSNIQFTSVRDAKSKVVLFKTSGRTPEKAEAKAVKVLDSITSDAIDRAIHTGEPIRYSSEIDYPKLQPTVDEIPWRDGANQSHSRFQHKTGTGEVRKRDNILEAADENRKKLKEYVARLRNPVAKHSAVTANAAGVHGKTSYSRKDKHKKNLKDE